MYAIVWCPNLSPTRDGWARVCIQTKPKSKTCKKLVYHCYIFEYILSYLRLKVSSISWTWLKKISLCAHIFPAILLAEYSDSMTSVNLTVYSLVFRMSVSFTILMKFQRNHYLPPFISLFLPDKFACIFTYDQFKEFHLQLALKEEEGKVKEE